MHIAGLANQHGPGLCGHLYDIHVIFDVSGQLFQFFAVKGVDVGTGCGAVILGVDDDFGARGPVIVNSYAEQTVHVADFLRSQLFKLVVFVAVYMNNMLPDNHNFIASVSVQVENVKVNGREGQGGGAHCAGTIIVAGIADVGVEVYVAHAVVCNNHIGVKLGVDFPRLLVLWGNGGCPGSLLHAEHIAGNGGAKLMDAGLQSVHLCAYSARPDGSGFAFGINIHGDILFNNQNVSPNHIIGVH